MNGFSLIVWLTMTQMPAVQVATLAGDQYQGTIEALSPSSVVVKTEAKSISIPLDELLSIRSTSVPTPTNDSMIEIRLVDNSRIRVKTMTSSGTVATVVHSHFGELKFPLSIISNVRLAPAESKVEAEWAQMIDRTIKKDVVVVRKGDVLDHLDGVIGSLNESTMQFQLDGDDIPIKREKVFGLIYSKRESSAKKAIAQLELVTGDQLAVKQIALSGAVWKMKTVSGLEFEITPELFQSLDYSLGKVSYLSDIKPRSVEHVEFFQPIKDISPPFVYRENMDFSGKPIRLYDDHNEVNSYAKGLAIHSKTLLRYRLGGDYRRFQAIMGIDADVPWGGVNVEIRGDKKLLFKSDVIAMETSDGRHGRRAKPDLLDIDVSGVVELEISVGWSSNERDKQGNPIRVREGGGRLNMANARVTK